MKDQVNSSGSLLIDEGILAANQPSLRCSDSEGRYSSAQEATPRLPIAPRPFDSTQHSHLGDFALSTEERQFIGLVAAGYSNKEMARHFALSESTIYRRAVRILDKVGAANRFELVLVAIFYGISAEA